MNSKSTNTFFVLLFCGLFLSCSESTGPDKKTPGYLFKATFTKDWLGPQDGQAIIFISDSEGNVLSEKTWSGNTSFEMYPDSNLNENIANSIDDITHIGVTTVVKGTITTNLNIPVGSSWTFKGYVSPDYSKRDTVTLDFNNIPDYTDYVIISSKWNSFISTSTSYFNTPINFYFYESPANIYIKLITLSSGVRYYWVKDVVSGYKQIDLSNMNLASSKTVNLPDNSGYIKFLDGIINPGHRYEGQQRLDYGRDFSPTNSIDIYHPADLFIDYRTSAFLVDELGQTEWYTAVYGEIPNSISKINADFEYVSKSMNNFEITTSGKYIQTASIWQYDNYSFTWVVYAGEEINKYKLPQLPNSAIQLFGLDRSAFELWLTDMVDYPELSSYSEVLNILFNSENYFYDIVNEIRRYAIYNSGNGFLKHGDVNDRLKKIHREPFIN